MRRFGYSLGGIFASVGVALGIFYAAHAAWLGSAIFTGMGITFGGGLSLTAKMQAKRLDRLVHNNIWTP